MRSIGELDGGLDGYNWKIRFGNDSKDGPIFVLKLVRRSSSPESTTVFTLSNSFSLPSRISYFWDVQPLEPPHYFAAQRECQNAALFQMMQAALSKQSNAALGPVLVNPFPTPKKAAKANLYAFSDEARARTANLGEGEGEGHAEALTKITQMPRMRRCYGWMRFTGVELLRRVPAKLHPPPIEVDRRTERLIDKQALHTAIVYEFVEDADNDPAAAQQVLDFLWRVGFGHVPITKAENWASGVLLDYSDIVHCNGQGWNTQSSLGIEGRIRYCPNARSTGEIINEAISFLGIP